MAANKRPHKLQEHGALRIIAKMAKLSDRSCFWRASAMAARGEGHFALRDFQKLLLPYKRPALIM